MLYTVKNNSANTRIIFAAGQKPVSIAPGAEGEAEMEPHEAGNAVAENVNITDPDGNLVAALASESHPAGWRPDSAGTVDLSSLSLSQLIAVAVAEGIIEDADEMRNSLQRAIEAKRGAEPHPLDHDANGEKGGAKPEEGEPAAADDITAAISLLDATNDAHWTATGLPAVEAVASIAGKPVTRAAINEAAPDAKRP